MKEIDSNEKKSRPTWRRRIIQFAPYVITAAVLTMLLRRYSIGAVLEEARKGVALPLIPLAFVGMVASLAIVSVADTLVLRGCGGAVRYFDMLRAKAGSSVLDTLGYAAGHGAYTVWIARFARIRPTQAAGAMLYIMAGDLTSVCVLASISVWIAGVHVLDPVTATVIPALGGLLLLGLLLGPSFRERIGRRLAILTPWSVVPIHFGLAQVGIRIVQLTAWILTTWLAAHLFGIPIPLPVMAASLPLVLLVASLPINVAGFGAVQPVWIHFFSPYAADEKVLAFQIVWQLLIILSVVLRGLPFVRRVLAEVDQGRPAAPDTNQ